MMIMIMTMWILFWISQEKWETVKFTDAFLSIFFLFQIMLLYINNFFVRASVPIIAVNIFCVQDMEHWLDLCERVTKTTFIFGDNFFERPGILREKDLTVTTSGIVMHTERVNTISDIIACANKFEGGSKFSVNKYSLHFFFTDGRDLWENINYSLIHSFSVNNREKKMKLKQEMKFKHFDSLNIENTNADQCRLKIEVSGKFKLIPFFFLSLWMSLSRID